MRFSKQYKSFSAWRKGKKNTQYVRKVTKLHQINPEMPLSTLRDAKIKDYDISKFSWNKLNSTQKYNRNLAFKILNSMRKGDSLKETSKRYGLTINQAKKYLGNSIYKKNGKWYAKKIDYLERRMMIYERDSGKVMVTIKHFKYARLIGQYFAVVRKALDTGDNSKLNNFENRPVIDSDKEKHYLETNLNNIYEYEEQIENSEFFEIYGD
jgi:hypothetical protein